MTVKATEELQRESARLARAEDVVGHVFVDRARLLSALTHRSFLNEQPTSVAHNEVLELLGDAVLSLVTVEELVRQTPGAEEGALTERRAAHVSAENLTRASTSSGLQALLRTGKGLRLAGNRTGTDEAQGAVGDNLAADVVEAVIGAVYLDAGAAGHDGLSAARRVVFRLLGAPPKDVVVVAAHAKRVLQERLQRLFGKPPEYVVTRADGPNHAPVYDAVVAWAGHTLGKGSGKNKRAATEGAAADAVTALAAVDDAALVARLSAAASAPAKP